MCEFLTQFYLLNTCNIFRLFLIVYFFGEMYLRCNPWKKLKVEATSKKNRDGKIFSHLQIVTGIRYKPTVTIEYV